MKHESYFKEEFGADEDLAHTGRNLIKVLPNIFKKGEKVEMQIDSSGLSIVTQGMINWLSGEFYIKSAYGKSSFSIRYVKEFSPVTTGVAITFLIEKKMPIVITIHSVA